MYDFVEHQRGSYRKPFTQVQYGVFTISSRDGGVKFVAACVSRETALNKAGNYYDSTDADPSEIKDFFIRTRKVTYDVWENE